MGVDGERVLEFDVEEGVRGVQAGGVRDERGKGHS